MRIIVFDIEIAKRVEDVAGGWAAARKGGCGISCVCLWDSETGRYHVYDTHTIEKCMAHLNMADLLVSYNGIGFDIPALEGFTGLDITAPSYDILKEIWDTAGKKIKGYKLGEVGPRTTGKMKVDTGEHAPQLFIEGRWGELVDYCINDVDMTKSLFNHIIEKGFVVSPDLEEFCLTRPDTDGELA